MGLQKKLGASSPSRQVRSPARSGKKVFSIKKSTKKPMWTEIVRRGIMKKKVTSKPKVVRSLLSNAVKAKKVFKTSTKKMLQKSVPAPNKKIFPQIASVSSTGHAESPETIVIRKRRSLPKSNTRKAEGLKSTPSDSSITTNTFDASGKVSRLPSSVKSRKSSSAAKTLLGSQKDSPDVSPVSTPNISQERFVSPLTTPRVPKKNNSYLEKYVLENQHEIQTGPVKSSRKSETLVGVKRLLKSGTPKADYSNVAGVKRLVQTPRASPKPDYCDVRGIKRLVQTPKDSPKADYRDVRGLRRLVQTPKDSPKADYSDVRGIKRLVQTPKDSPKADYRDVDDVKNLFRTPASGRRGAPQAKTVSIKQLYQNRTPLADYTKVKGVKQLFKSVQPAKGKARARKVKNAEVGKEPDFTNVEGVKQLFREPEENEFNISGLQQLFSPEPSVAFGAKTDIVPPTAQEVSPLIQKISSPRSRRKQSFGSSSSAINMDDSTKSVQVASVAQENTFAAEYTADIKDVASPPTVKEAPDHRVIETPGLSSKAPRSTRSVTAIPSQQQTPDSVHSPTGRKSARMVVPLDTPLLSTSGKSPKVGKPGKTVTSPVQPVMSATTPSITSPKTRQQTPLSAKDKGHERKTSQSQKQRRGTGKEEKADIEANKIESPSALQSVSPVSNLQRTKRGRRNANANRIPEIIDISSDDESLSEQKPKRGGRSAVTTSKHETASVKGRKKDANQEVSDLVELQQAVNQANPKKSRAMRSQMACAAEIVASEAVPNIPEGRRATRSKVSAVRKRGDSQSVTGIIAPKGSRSTRSKRNADVGEVSEHTEETSDSYVVGDRASRRKMVVSPELVGNSSAVSSPKVNKRSKAVKLVETKTREDSPRISGDEERNEIIEVKGKGTRRTRGRGQAVGTPVKKTDSQFLPSADENSAGRVTRRGAAQTRARQNFHPKADSSEAAVEDSSALLKGLPHQENASTTPPKQTVNKQKHGNLTSGVGKMLASTESEAIAGTPGSAKSFKTRKNQKFRASAEDKENNLSKTDCEVVGVSEKSRKSKNMILCKSDDATSSLATESVKGDTNMPSMSKDPRPRRNQKASQREDVTVSDFEESGDTLTGTRRSKRGSQPEDEKNLILPKKPRTPEQKYTSSASSAESSGASIESGDTSDAVRRSTRGKTVRVDTSCESTEVPHARRSKKQSKKTSVNEDNTASQMAVNKTVLASSEKCAVESPSSQNVAVKKGQVNDVVQVPSELEKPKRVGRATRGVASVSSDDSDAEAVNLKRPHSKRRATDPAADAVSPKRTRKTATKEVLNAVEEVTRTAKMQPKSSKTKAPFLEAIPEVEEEITVTPTVKKATRAKASTKQNIKKSPLRRPTRSRRK